MPLLIGFLFSGLYVDREIVEAETKRWPVHFGFLWLMLIVVCECIRVFAWRGTLEFDTSLERKLEQKRAELDRLLEQRAGLDRDDKKD